MDWITTFIALKSVYIDEAFSNIAINEAIEQHPGCSTGFVRTFTKGVIRDTIKLDYYINRLAARGIKGIKKRTLIILRMGIYAIESLDSVPDHAACNEAVKLARKVSKGSDGFVNGILRSFIRQRDDLAIERNYEPGSDEYLSIRYSFPIELVRLIRSQYDSETESLLDALNRPTALVLRPNRLKFNTIEPIIADGGNYVGTEEFRAGHYSVQSLSSIEAIEHFAPQPGSSVLDMCAAPGGKSCAMAEIMGNRGLITACDVYDHRLELINAQAKRLGITIITTELMDGTIFNDELENSFDYVLADVPCSGLGVIPSKPEIKFRTKVSDYDELTEIQYKILKNAVSYARDGGYIEYSTCTINNDENDKVIDRLMKECKLVHVLEKNSILPYNNKVGFYYCIMQKALVCK